ncbi:hypothetical protein [Mycetocola saprophilus]|uniref:hypothetical protein n=1 Tax=Mycetocola saprophilus TaxID=76636 RepID=UPI003BF13483
MSVVDSTNTAATAEAEAAASAEADQIDASATDASGTDTQLGEAGKKALEAERAARKLADKAAKASAAELATLKAELALKEKPESEQELARVRAEAKAESDAAANKRILRSELRAAAKGKLADPADVGLYIDLDEFAVGEDGEVDSSALDAAIADLIESKPHLAATPERRFGGSADLGAKGRQNAPAQLTRSDLSTMTPAEVLAADRNGQLDKLKGKN